MSLSIEQVLQQAVAVLSTSSDSAQLDAEILLADILQKDRTFLRTWPEHRLTNEQARQFSDLIKRRQQGEPVAYITGKQGFWSLALSISNDTLIPRPETELLVEQALQIIPQNICWQIMDLGTGSGAIALALAKERPASHFVATDIDFASLKLAQQNAVAHHIMNVHFVAAHWLTPFNAELQLDMVVSNPPYIMSGDPHLKQGDVRYEPERALASGKTGLDDIRLIIKQSYTQLKPEGWLLIEHGYHQAEDLHQLMHEQGFISINNLRDYGNQPRLSLCQKKDKR
ncbi:MAG: peptide chain release factor N(5)-glutamine methyltransferase [Gammaproteobacteria bacterium]|nr:peptide chain release factor N(5)-glutamine methyltransferase [Gammaproteobacteria bacterium]